MQHPWNHWYKWFMPMMRFLVLTLLAFWVTISGAVDIFSPVPPTSPYGLPSAPYSVASPKNGPIAFFSTDTSTGDTGTTYDFTGGSLPGGMIFSRGTSGTDYSSVSIVTVYPSATARFGSEPSLTIARGLYIEGSGANRLLRSSEIDNASWVKTNTAVSANATTAPDGTGLADKLTMNSTTTAQYVLNQTVAGTVSATWYTHTFYAKQAEQRYIQNANSTGYGSASSYANYDLANCTIKNTNTTNLVPDIRNVGNGWCRIQYSFLTTGTGTSSFFQMFILNTGNESRAPNVTGTVGNGVYIWGLMNEASVPFSTSYISTTTASVSRSADSAIISSSLVPYNATSSSAIVKFQMEGVSNTQPVLQYDDGTDNNRIVVQAVNGLLYFNVVSGSVSQVSISLGTVTSNTSYSVGYAINTNDFAVSLNGSAVSTTASGQIPTGITTVRMGSDVAGNKLFGWIAKWISYQTRINNSTLQTNTGNL